MKAKPKKHPLKRISKKKDPNRYPKGLNRQKVRKIIDHYENQTDDEAIAEDEAADHSTTSTMMQIPNALVPKVQRLISKRVG